jgi:hypothetical protein
MRESRSTSTRPQDSKNPTTQANLQKTSRTFKSETHRQLSIQAAQEAHTVPGVSNLGHPPEHTQSQTHLIAALCLLKPSQRRKLLRGLSQEEEEAKTPQADQATSHKTPSTSEIYSTSPSEGPLAPLTDLEGLVGLEDQEDQMFPPLTLFPSNPEET